MKILLFMMKALESNLNIYHLIILANSDKSTCFDIDLRFLHLGILMGQIATHMDDTR